MVLFSSYLATLQCLVIRIRARLVFCYPQTVNCSEGKLVAVVVSSQCLVFAVKSGYVLGWQGWTWWIQPPRRLSGWLHIITPAHQLNLFTHHFTHESYYKQQCLPFEYRVNAKPSHITQLSSVAFGLYILTMYVCLCLSVCSNTEKSTQSNSSKLTTNMLYSI